MLTILPSRPRFIEIDDVWTCPDADKIPQRDDAAIDCRNVAANGTGAAFFGQNKHSCEALKI